jgi:hypothetical protein
MKGKKLFRGEDLDEERGGVFPFLIPLAVLAAKALATGAATGAGAWGATKILDKIKGNSPDIHPDPDAEGLFQYLHKHTKDYRHGPGMTERDLMELHGSGFRETVMGFLKVLASKLGGAAKAGAKSLFTKQNLDVVKKAGAEALKHAGQAAVEKFTEKHPEEIQVEEEFEDSTRHPAVSTGRKTALKKRPARRPITNAARHHWTHDAVRRRGGGYATNYGAPIGEFFQPFTRGPLGAYPPSYYGRY